jgi:hypothetical protein
MLHIEASLVDIMSLHKFQCSSDGIIHRLGFRCSVAILACCCRMVLIVDPWGR